MKLAVALLLTITQLTTVCLAQTDKTASTVDSKAEKVLREMAALMQNANAIQLQSSMEIKMQAQGFNQQMDSEFRIAAQRPNKFAMVIEKGSTGATMVSDGKTLYTYLPTARQYTAEDAPANLENMSDELGESGMALSSGGFVIVDVFFASNPYERFLENVDNIKYVGLEKIGDNDCHRLTYQQQGVPVDIWIESGKQAVMRQLVPTLPDQDNPMQPNAPPIEMTMTMQFAQWEVNPKLGDDAFKFAPPQGAKKVKSFFAGMMQEPPKHAMTGKEAPDLKLELLQGGTMKLAEHEGNDIVILDFWASWCRPCIMAMPMVMDVAEAYKDKNVVFYAVNQLEHPDKIRKFLAKKKWSLPVALDSKGNASRAMQVRGIPHTYVIDKDGVVQVVHIGYLPNLKEKLTQELDQILAGNGPADSKTKDAMNEDAG